MHEGKVVSVQGPIVDVEFPPDILFDHTAFVVVYDRFTNDRSPAFWNVRLVADTLITIRHSARSRSRRFITRTAFVSSRRKTPRRASSF